MDAREALHTLRDECLNRVVNLDTGRAQHSLALPKM